MIGPQAWENFFMAANPMKVLELHYYGVRYTYLYDWEVLEMFGNKGAFKAWCLHDITHYNGMHADKQEMIE